MKRAKIVVGSILVLIVGAGAAFYMLGGMDKVRAAFQPPQDQEKNVTLEGKVLCLPRSSNSATSPLSCAIGLQATDGKYYGLSSSSNDQLSSAAGTDKEVKISGDLQPPTDDTYKMEGIIAVNDFHFVE